MEKKVSISLAFYNKLINDMETFGFKNQNGEYKQNHFFTTVIVNTYKYRNQNKNLLIEQMKNVLLDKENKLENNEIIELIKQKQYDPYFNQNITDLAILLTNKTYNFENTTDSNKKNIFIRSTFKNEDDLEEIVNSSSNLAASYVFKNILQEYISYPMYIREKILFLDIFDKLNYLKNHNLSCTIESKKEYKNTLTGEIYNNKFLFDVYDVVVGKEEYHYYVIGKGKNINNKYERTIMSIKLSSIKQVISLNKTFVYDNNEINEFKEKLLNGAEWINGDYEKIEVLFTDYGLKLYEALYKDRPNYISIKDNLLTFFTNGKALTNYLKPFGRHAKIISPETLNDSLLSFYEKAYNNLKKHN